MGELQHKWLVGFGALLLLGGGCVIGASISALVLAGIGFLFGIEGLASIQWVAISAILWGPLVAGAILPTFLRSPIPKEDSRSSIYG